ncbi:redoxin domain-containing protein [Lutibaculum baratangense]|uniref:Alkyl hydroperoxide reductase n=1 Tax=Lutibaculum baratangense AMV1 TaxID=631454 RepID=V4REQ8_9HYPH|nr:redoxin domain-containing protein [Lutibaculum baratangense]ESR24626.1 alkyl hydroperoxide reductase [Lutibaculum baratangense AMV1]
MSETRYAYEHVSSEILSDDMQFRKGAPKAGDRLPEFDLPTAEGGWLRTRDLAGRPVLLVTGSFTCPMTASSNPILKELHGRFGHRIEFIMLYVREAHPGEHHDQAGVAEEKRNAARSLQQRDRLPWTIVVDDPDGSIHRRLDEKPNAAYLTDETGTIVFRSLWAGDERGLVQALEAVARGEQPSRSESTRRLVPMARGVGTMREMTRRAGPRAQSDLWQAAPPMGLMASLADLYRPLPPAWRTAAAAATLGVGVAVVATLAARAISRR